MPPSVRSSLSFSRRRTEQLLLGQTGRGDVVEVHAFEFLQPLDPLDDGAEVGEHAAQPALVHEGHPDPGRLLGDGFLGLLLGADEQHLAAAGDGVLDERVRAVDVGQRLLQVDDVDAVALGEDEALHLGIPAAGLMPEVDAALEELAGGDDGHGRYSSPYRTGCARRTVVRYRTVRRRLMSPRLPTRRIGTGGGRPGRAPGRQTCEVSLLEGCGQQSTGPYEVPSPPNRPPPAPLADLAMRFSTERDFRLSTRTADPRFPTSGEISGRQGRRAPLFPTVGEFRDGPAAVVHRHDLRRSSSVHNQSATPNDFARRPQSQDVRFVRAPRGWAIGWLLLALLVALAFAAVPARARAEVTPTLGGQLAGRGSGGGGAGVRSAGAEVGSRASRYRSGRPGRGTGSWRRRPGG